MQATSAYQLYQAATVLSFRPASVTQPTSSNFILLWLPLAGYQNTLRIFLPALPLQIIAS
jgi:hypothetical protein